MYKKYNKIPITYNPNKKSFNYKLTAISIIGIIIITVFLIITN